MSPRQYKNKNARRWRCFFCDEVFTTRKAAAIHFGVNESCEADETACKLMSHQQKIVEYIRDLEAEVRRLQGDAHAESHPLLRSLYDLETRAAEDVRKAEEAGYVKGVRDMRTQGYCIDPSKHHV